MAGVVVTLLLSQFGTVSGGAQPMRALDEPVGASTSGELADGWRPIRGRWATGAGGARVVAGGERLSVAVRPVGGVDGTIEVGGLADVDGWSVVWRWQDPGTYGLVVFEPTEATVSLVAVVSDRTRLLAQGPLPRLDGRADAGRLVSVALEGSVVKVRMDGELVVAGRDDRLRWGSDAGVGVVRAGADPPDHQARFTRFASRPPEPVRARAVEPGAAG